MTGAAKAALVVITVGGDIGCSQYSEGTKMVCAMCVTRTWHGSVMPSEIPDRCLYLDGNDRPNDTVGSCLYCVHLNIVYMYSDHWCTRDHAAPASASGVTLAAR